MTEPQARPVPLRVPGTDAQLAIFVHGERDRHVSRQLREQGLWEPYETRLMMGGLQPGSVFLDVGANLGYFSCDRTASTPGAAAGSGHPRATGHLRAR